MLPGVGKLYLAAMPDTEVGYMTHMLQYHSRLERDFIPSMSLISFDDKWQVITWIQMYLLNVCNYS